MRHVVLSEDQFETLRRYEDGRPTWSEKVPDKKLIERNLLMRATGCGPGFYRITGYGRAMLAEFREAHGTP